MFSFDEMGDHVPSKWRVNKSPMKSTRLRKAHFSLAGLFMPRLLLMWDLDDTAAWALVRSAAAFSPDPATQGAGLGCFTLVQLI